MNSSEAKKLFEKGLQKLIDKKYKESIEFFESSLKLAPNKPSILKNLIIAYINVNNFSDAEKYLKLLILYNQNEKDIIKIINIIFKEKDRINDFIKFFDSIDGKIDPIIKIKKDLFLPKIYNDKEEAIKFRKNFEKKLDENLLNNNLNKTKLEIELLDPPVFQLSYNNYNNKELFSKTVQLLRNIYPELNYKKQFIDKKKQKIKIGFISEFFCDHTIGKLFKGIILQLNQDRFDVNVFHSHKTEKNNIYKEFINAEKNSNIRNFTLPEYLKDGKKIIENQDLDILFFTDIGMSSEFYYYSFLRLAKYQITTWGHPETTGNETIDYFLSSKLIETENAQSHYTEKLLLLDLLPMYFYKPKINQELDENKLNSENFYSCPQSLFKIHPDFDLIINSILKEDKKAKIYFLKDKNGHLFKKLIERFKKNLGSNFERCIFLEQLSYTDFINHCGHASVILDPYYFGSGTSFHEAMYYGTPTVTKPTNYMKSRVVLGAYNQMKIEDAPVAKSDDEYVHQAINIANNSKKNIEYKKHLRESALNHLYENNKIIQNIESLLESLLN